MCARLKGEKFWKQMTINLNATGYATKISTELSIVYNMTLPISLVTSSTLKSDAVEVIGNCQDVSNPQIPLFRQGRYIRTSRSVIA